MSVCVEQYEVTKEASYIAREWKYTLNGNEAAFTSVQSDRPGSPSFSPKWPVTLQRMRQRHHDACKEFAHATVDERLAYNSVAHILCRYRRATGSCCIRLPLGSR